MNGTVKKIQETTPFFKNGRFIFLLSKLIIDILKLNCFCIVMFPDTAYAIREHALKRNTLLCGPRDSITFSISLNNTFNLLLLFS